MEQFTKYVAKQILIETAQTHTAASPIRMVAPCFFHFGV